MEFEGCEVIEHFTSRTKPLCVFGVLLSERGKQIKKEMLEWLVPEYDVITVEQDEPGIKFEYPALRYIKEIITDDDPVLYVHTKGAANQSYLNKKIINLWKNEFINNKRAYFDEFTDKNVGIVVCPFTSNDGITWFNGFIANKKAFDSTTLLDSFSDDRYIYEVLFRDVANVIGTIDDNIDRSATMMRVIENYNIE